MRIFLFLTCLIAGQVLYGQATLPAFGNYSAEEVNLTECPFEKTADAVILFDEAVSDHDDDYRLLTRRRIRIKILNQRGIEQGTIRIRFYSKDNFEYIRNIRGRSFVYVNGVPEMSSLDNKTIFTEKEDNYYSSIKFAFPNVRAGSIIEYEYESTMKNYGGLSSWLFQNDIPTLKSCYLLTLLPNTEFQYFVHKKSNYPVNIKPMPEAGKIYFEMNNIKGLKFEPYMDAVRDYLQKVEFQLAGYTSRGSFTKVNQTWKALAYDLITEKEFGGVIKKELKIDEIKDRVSKETTDAGRIAAIYNYVRTNFTWNGYYGKYAMNGLKNTVEKRSGTSGEINLLLINLLESFNVEVYPLLVAERDFGKVDTSYPIIDMFNKVAAYAIADGKVFILDATQKYCPPGLTPYPVLNTVAFLVDKKKPRIVYIGNEQDKYMNVITVNGKVDSKGLLAGSAEISSTGYAKQLRTESARTNPKKFISETLQEAGGELVVDECKFDNIDNDNAPLVQKINFHQDLNVSGGFVFLPYNFFTGLVKNPFTATERFTNVNFGYPYNINLKVNVQLPEGFSIDKLPPDKTLVTPNKEFSATRKLKIDKNSLVASIEFIQNTTLVPYAEYDNLRYYYKQMIDLLNDPVVMKIAN